MHQLLVSAISVRKSIMKSFDHHPMYTSHREIVREYTERQNLESFNTNTTTTKILSTTFM